MDSSCELEEELPVRSNFKLFGIVLNQNTNSLTQSSIRQIIRTNTIPSNSQASEIRELIAKRKLEHDSTEDSASLRAHINDLEALLSPARSLIPEIVSCIFEACVSTQGRLPTPNPQKAPLLLMQICADWRRIALSTPKVKL